MVKLLEKIINTRLKCFLETEKLLVPQQAGFREHQCTYLSQEIEDEFQRKKETVSVWIDLYIKTFDKVWTDGLLLKLRRCNISGICSSGSNIFI